MPLALPFKISVPKTETTVNLKSASFVVIMLLHEGLTHIQSQIKPCLLFGESFALRLEKNHGLFQCRKKKSVVTEDIRFLSTYIPNQDPALSQSAFVLLIQPQIGLGTNPALPEGYISFTQRTLSSELIQAVIMLFSTT